MNIQNNLSYYIDATNEFSITGGGGSSCNITIAGGGGNTLNDYLYTSNSGNAYQLYLNTPHTDGEIRFKVLNNNNNPNYSQDHRIKITKDGKLQLYHVYNPFIPTYASGWYDISDEIINLKFGSDLQSIEITAIGVSIGLIEGQITDIYSLITLLNNGIGELTKSLEYTQDQLTQVYSKTDWYRERYRENYNQIVQDFAEINDRTKTFTQNIISGTANITGTYGTALQIGGIGVGLIGAIYGLSENEKVYNASSNLSNANFEITPSQRRELLDSNLSNALTIANDFSITLSNCNIYQGFINSNIIDTQFIPSLKSNKVLLGDITTPNAAYQMEMTGDLNLNQLYINSVSLSSLLNQKQNNLTAVAPIYITTGNIGITYDSSLTKVGNNLSVVKTATAPLNWTGNDIALSYDNTLINNAGSLGLSIAAESKWLFSGGNIYNKALTNVGIGTDSGLTYKLNVIGDTYLSSNTHIGVSKLSFISSYSGQSAFALATGTNEYYIEFNSAGGTLILNEPCACDIFMVGAGGNGGTGASSGGGGAGEVIYFPNFPLRSGNLNITVGISSSIYANRTSKITLSGSSDLITARGGGNGGSVLYSTSGGTVSALTPITGTMDAFISITASTTLILDKSLTCDILVIGGGGSGRHTHGSGGGAGAVIYLTNQTLNFGNYTITIGAGGICPNTVGISQKGQDTTINYNGTNIYLALGGGGGGGGSSYTDGGSGGGENGVALTTNIPSGLYGNNGGSFSHGPSTWNGGGGGGAGAVGGVASQATGAGAGGPGRAITITGSSVFYGGGGGGGSTGNNFGASGGSGGGGSGGSPNQTVQNGVANTGGGGGGGFSIGGTGGSGVVIIRFIDYYTQALPNTGGSGGGGGKNQSGASAGVKFDDYKSFALAGLSGNSTTGGNGGAGNTTYSRYTTTITGSSLSVALGGTGVGASPATPTTKTNYGDGGDGNGGVGFQGIVIIRFKVDSNYLQIKSIKDNANSGLILNANESPNVYQLRVYPWSDTYTSTGIAVRGWSMRVHDGNNHLDLLNLFSSFGGRIGIKTKNPTATFDVNGDINCKTFNVIGNELYGITCQVVNQHDTGEASINVSAGASGNYGAMSVVYLPSQNLGYISCSKSLQIKTQSIGGYIHIDNTTGYVGIGNNLPQAKLHVSGTILSSSVSVTTVNADSVAAGNISCTSLDLNNGSIIGVNKLTSVELETGPIKCGAINLQGSGITNGATIQGTCTQARFLLANVNEWHYSQDNRNRFYFTDDGTNSHTVIRTGSTTTYFQDKDGVDYALLDRFGISSYFEVISGSGYDNLGVLDASSTGVYVYRRILVRLSTFTEVHRCFIFDELYTNYDDFINEFVGRVVVSTGQVKTALKDADEPWRILEGKDAITIDDSHPIVELSRKKKDKRVVGVITKRNQNNDLPNRLVINSLGETAIYVVNTNGNIENGDLLTTSNELGYAEKQDDDIIRNYTIGKCMISCDFDLDSPNYKCEDLGNGLLRAYLPIFIYSG